LLRRSLEGYLEKLKESSNGLIDFNSLLRQNLNEILELKIANEHLSVNVEQFQRQLQERDMALGEMQCSIVN